MLENRDEAEEEWKKDNWINRLNIFLVQQVF